jgi:hypothetical protein
MVFIWKDAEAVSQVVWLGSNRIKGNREEDHGFGNRAQGASFSKSEA